LNIWDMATALLWFEGIISHYIESIIFYGVHLYVQLGVASFGMLTKQCLSNFAMP
jgi:hypothetical protein